MKNSSYLRKFKHFEKLRFLTDGVVLEGLESLNAEEWRYLIKDVVIEPAKLAHVFPARTGDDTLIYLCTVFTKLGGPARKSLSIALDSLVSESYSSGDFLTKSEVINSYYLVAKKLGEGIRPDLLLHIIVDETLGKDVRAGAAAVLANLRTTVPLAVWDKLDLKKHTFALPAWVTYRGRRDPIEVFETIKRLQDNPYFSRDLRSLKYPLEAALESVDSQRNFLRIERIVKDFNEPLQNFVRKLPMYKRHSGAYQVQSENIEILYEEGALYIPSGTITLDRIEQVVDKISQLQLIEKYRLHELPSLLERLEQKPNSQVIQNEIQDILSSCLRDRKESIGLFRTIFDKSRLAWKPHPDRRYERVLIFLLADNKKVGQLQVTDKFFTAPSDLNDRDFVDLALAESVFEETDA